MTKRKKKKIIYSAILLALGIIIVLISLFFVKYKTVDNYMTARAYHYLSAKYDADESEFTLIDYDKAHWFLNDDDFPELERAPYKWEFEYNGRKFFVNRLDRKFYDDYQLEEIEQWCVEWLQENVFSDILHIELNSFDLWNYQMKFGNTVIRRENIEVFLTNKPKSRYKTFVYFESDNEGASQQIQSKVDSVLSKDVYYACNLLHVDDVDLFEQYNHLEYIKQCYRAESYWMKVLNYDAFL